MRVLLTHSLNSAGSVHYRIKEPALAVHEAGLGVEVEVALGLATTVLPGGQGPEIVDVDSRGADVVVFQLPKTVEMLQCIRLLKARGVAVVVEMDDLLSSVPYGHPGHGSLVRSGMAQLAVECAKEADLVTVSTPALLKEYAPHGRGVVVPNAIPRRIAELPPAYEREPDHITIGWTGSVAGHPYDLQEVGSGLRQALDATRGSSRFLIFGVKEDARVRLGLTEEPDELRWMHDVDAYLETVGVLFDVGLAPLRMDRFNESKSWLKPLEYSARGVFCVRARTSEYERLGLGLPARAPKDWAKWITTGVRDADRRRELAAAAHGKVLSGHLTEHTAEQWVAAWRTALDTAARRRGTALAAAAGA